MNDYELGAALRERVLQDRMRGLPHDGRRLQAVVGDLCGADQDLLLPALRHLVMSAAFGSAAGQPRPLADARLESRLMAELREVFAPRIVARMEAVVRGLLALEASGPPLEAPRVELPKAEGATPMAPTPVVPTPVAPVVVPAPEAPAEVAPIERRGSGALVALLAFLSGGLSLALVLLVTRQPGELPPAAGTASVPSQPRPQPDRPSPPEEPAGTPPPVQPEAVVAEASDDAPKADERQAIDSERVDQAVRAVQQVYAALSSRDYDSARALFAAAAADQFDPQFFSQFERVSVTDLQVSGAAGSNVNLRGLVTFVYPDGSVQTEAREFTVDTSATPALITASEFGRVVSPRRR